jgi:hypothetical protein
VIDFPELQQALVDAAGRRYAPRRRAWRIVRVAVPAAAVLALIVVLTGDRPSDERPATPSPTPVATLEPTDALSRNYEVFRRPPTSADVLPGEPFVPLDARTTRVDPDRVRLLFERGDNRIYAVAATRTDRPGVCVLQFVGDARGEGACTDVNDPVLGGTVTWLPLLIDGSPAIAALAGDDISEFEVEFADGTSERPTLSDGAVLVPGEPWPTGLAWRTSAGGSAGVALAGEEPTG